MSVFFNPVFNVAMDLTRDYVRVCMCVHLKILLPSLVLFPFHILIIELSYFLVRC